MHAQGKIIGKILVGYDKLEPILLTNAALGFNTLLLAKHGVGKTKLVKALGSAFDKMRGSKVKGFRYVDCAKANLIQLAGLPNPKLTEENGTLTFTHTNSAVVGKDVTVICLDEITRANKESQNLYLEMLEEKTLHGIPLHYDAVIATANPHTYTGTFKLDAALYDRFFAVVPMPPVLDECDENTIARMIDVNKNRDDNLDEIRESLAELITQIRAEFKRMYADPDINKRVSEFISALYAAIEQHRPTVGGSAGKSEKLYISARNIVHQLPKQIIGLAAYYSATGHKKALWRAAQQAVDYNLSHKHQNPDFNKVVSSATVQLRFILDSATDTDAGRLTLQYAKIKDINSSIKFVNENIDDIDKLLDADQITAIVGGIIERCKRASREDFIARMITLVKGREKMEHIYNECYGGAVFAVCRKAFGKTDPETGERSQGIGINPSDCANWQSVEKYLGA